MEVKDVDSTNNLNADSCLKNVSCTCSVLHKVPTSRCNKTAHIGSRIDATTQLLMVTVKSITLHSYVRFYAEPY